MEHDLRDRQLQDALLAEASGSIRGLAGRGDILAAILTGSAAWGRPNPQGDIDILLITSGGEGVYYRYLIPGFSPVKRRTEHGFIPRAVVVKLIEAAYGSNISCAMLEQLKNGRVLFQRDGEGDELVRRSREAVPGAFVIGARIHELADALSRLADAEAGGDFGETVLSARRIVRIAAHILLFARHRTAVSKEKHEHRAIEKMLERGVTAWYRDVMGVQELGSDEAPGIIERAVAVVRWALERKSISGRLVDYGRIA